MNIDHQHHRPTPTAADPPASPWTWERLVAGCPELQSFERSVREAAAANLWWYLSWLAGFGAFTRAVFDHFPGWERDAKAAALEHLAGVYAAERQRIEIERRVKAAKLAALPQFLADQMTRKEG